MLFNKLGRIIPTINCRVFSDEPKTFYKIDPITIDYPNQHSLAKSNGLISDTEDLESIQKNLFNIEKSIKSNIDFKDIFNSTAIPFCFSLPEKGDDLGNQLENFWLPMLKKEYEKQVPNAYFKATLQGNTELKDSLKLSKNTGYNIFLEKCKNALVAGFYFPTAFQEFDIESQRNRIAKLPTTLNLDLCLSGPFEIIYSLISYPRLLFSKNNYSPILCASALEHNDPRMVMLFKSYGPHLEFWLLTQMLTPTKTQVSEQWSGGITIFKSFE